MSEPIQSIAQNNYILQAPPPTATMFTTELEYDGDKISGYAGSAFKAGDEFPISADEAVQYVQTNSGTIDETVSNVQTNSAAWGTDTLPISACDGVKLVPSDGMILAKLDETVLYTATAATNSITLSEKCTNFERLRLELKSYQSPTVINYTEVKPDNTTLTYFAQTLIPAATYPLQILGVQFTGTNGINYNMSRGVRFYYKNNDHGGNDSTDMTSNIKDAGFITKIVGINRLSGSV